MSKKQPPRHKPNEPGHPSERKKWKKCKELEDEVYEDEFVQERFLTKKEINYVIQSFFKKMIMSMQKGQDVYIWQIGRFTLRDCKEHTVTDPETGDVTEVPAQKIIVFKPSGNFKRRLGKNVWYQARHNRMLKEKRKQGDKQ